MDSHGKCKVWILEQTCEEWEYKDNISSRRHENERIGGGFWYNLVNGMLLFMEDEGVMLRRWVAM